MRCALPQSVPLKQGSLLKLGSATVFRGEKLQRRYFELRETALVYGNSATSGLYGVIDITGGRVMDAPAYPHGFSLIGPHLARAYVLVAATEGEKVEWSDMIRHAVQRQDFSQRAASLRTRHGHTASMSYGAMSASMGVSLDYASMPGQFARNAESSILDDAFSASEAGYGTPTPQGSSYPGGGGEASPRRAHTALGLGATAAARARNERHRGSQVGLRDLEMLRVLGTGAHSTVVLVRDRSGGDDGATGAGRLYALKGYDKASLLGANSISTVVAERAVLGTVATAARTPPLLPELQFIAGLRNAFQSGTHLFLLLDFYPGGDLFFHLQMVRRFTEERARLCLAEIATAVDVLHQRGVVVRDVRPENVFLRADGHCVLGDLAAAVVPAELVAPARQPRPTTPGVSSGGAPAALIAAVAEEPSTVSTVAAAAAVVDAPPPLSARSSAVASSSDRSALYTQPLPTLAVLPPEYCAPELLDETAPPSPASDFWALGVLLYEMVAGVPPFFPPSRDPHDIVDAVLTQQLSFPSFFSNDLKEILTRLLDRDPAVRLRRLEDMRFQPFFSGLDLGRVGCARTTPEFVPTELDGSAYGGGGRSLSLHYFSHRFTDLPLPSFLDTAIEDGDSGTSMFAGFTYPPPPLAAAAEEAAAAAAAAGGCNTG